MFARTLETFQGTHILGASRGRLCDSKAFLLYYATVDLEMAVAILGMQETG